jgi:2-C-methyl-D-erythritol 4-phosphate cytidylyltransferase/2-C-methyl-D-erythritol 2,4-cyclodiphosphate synthase
MAFRHPVGVIIPAAGSGVRMGTAVPKQFFKLAGIPVLARTLRVFLDHPAVVAVVAVMPLEHLQSGAASVLPLLSPGQQEKLSFVVGGATRQDSVRKGLEALPAGMEYLLVHDAARPLISRAIIDRCLAGIQEHGAALAAVPVKDTLKKVEEGRVVATVDRTRLWQAQTPQGMTRSLLERAYQKAEASGFVGTDEASLLEHAGLPVAVVMGSEENTKLTRPEDLSLATARVQQKEGGMRRIGHGFDAHRFVEGRKLILGGEHIPYPLGLEGHSDADVLVHALMDALLGALALGDIGRHFPDKDPQYSGADSLKLLAQVMQWVQERGMQICNADITVICQQPKLAPHIPAMQAQLAAVCRIAPEQINIKATTTEKMGYTGRGEGISSHAVVLLSSGSEDVFACIFPCSE